MFLRYLAWVVAFVSLSLHLQKIVVAAIDGVVLVWVSTNAPLYKDFADSFMFMTLPLISVGYVLILLLLLPSWESKEKIPKAKRVPVPLHPTQDLH